jgi:hypothetical protein
MENPLIGTGFVVVGAVVWVVCVMYAFQNAPKFGRSAVVWTGLTIVFGPLALMVLYILPKHEPDHAAPGHAKRADPHAALYEVPKKHH